MEHERFDRVVAAGATNGDGFSSDDVAWLLENAPGTVLIIRPGRPSDKPVRPAVVSQNGSARRTSSLGGSGGLPGRSRNQRANDAVLRVLLRMPEDPEHEFAA
jgi:hypothetical protein